VIQEATDFNSLTRNAMKHVLPLIVHMVTAQILTLTESLLASVLVLESATMDKNG